MRIPEASELAALRRALRDHLMSQDPTGALPPLARLREVCEGDLELRAEYERWWFRFELLTA